MNWRNNTDFWYAFNITASALILFFAIAVPLLSAFTSYTKTVDIKALQGTDAISLHTETTFTVAIDNASTTPLNAIEFELVYDPTQIEILRMVPHTTLCEERFIISNHINTTSGTALFQCGTVTPFTSATGTIATVYARSLQTGTTTISFGKLTHVLAHDGYGTDATKERIPLTLVAY